MKTEHEGLPVKGYKKTQSQEDIDLVNEGKILEERVLRYIERIGAKDGMDPRMAALAKTNVQQGFYWAFRAVFQPGRVDLPEDD